MRAEQSRENDDNEEIGQRIQDIHEAHHPLIRTSADVPSDRPPRDANGQAHSTGQQADQKGDAYAVQSSDKQITPQAVRAEPMGCLQPRRHCQVFPVERVVSIRAHRRPQ